MISLSAHAGFFSKNRQSILKIECEKTFEIKASPFNENEAGTSEVLIQYFYDGKELPTIVFEKFYLNLNDFIPVDPDVTKTYGLKLNTSGLASFESFDIGHSVFLDSTVFSIKDFSQLDKCLSKNSSLIRKSFEETVVESSTFLGLMKTKSKINAKGVARLIYKPYPFADIIENCLLLVRDGQIFYFTNYTADSNNQRVLVGYWEKSVDGIRLKLSLKGFDLLKKVSSNPDLDLLKWKNQFGKSLKSLKYKIEISEDSK